MKRDVGRQMMKTHPIMWLLIGTACLPVLATKLTPDYISFRNIAMHSSTNRYSQSVYVGGWLNNCGVYQWRRGMTLGDVIDKCGGVYVKKGEHIEQWEYRAHVIRPTANNPDPHEACHSVVISSDAKERQKELEFLLIADDAVQVLRNRRPTMQSSVPATRGTAAAYAPAAPRVPVR